MTKLYELAGLIRSKNAGPFALTYDVLFRDAQSYHRVKAANVFTSERMGELLEAAPDTVKIFACDNALAFKVTVPRRWPAGHPADADLHGGQQFAPLMEIEIA